MSSHLLRASGLRARAAWCLGSIVLLSGCPLPLQPPEPSPGPIVPAPTPDNPASQSAPVGIRTTVQGPAKVTYDPRSLGAPGASVRIHVENVSSETVTVAPLRATFRTSRRGVAFPCTEVGRSTSPSREPLFLQPGQSFDYERPLSCSMPLPGAYDVRVYVHFANKETMPQESGHFSLELASGAANGPQPYPGVDGLFVLMTGAHTTRPLSSEEWARGDYQVLLAFVNGGPHPVSVGPGHIAFLVYKHGTALPCSGQEAAISAPEELKPGTMHIARTPVACAPSDEGNYSIVGRLKVDRIGTELVVGKIPLRVSGDPRVLAPMPWESWSGWPNDPGRPKSQP